MNKKIKMTKIILERVEGKTWECVSKECNTWESADKTLSAWCASVEDGNSFKSDFTVFFEDGFQYEGHYELSSESNDLLKNHMKGHILFVAGKNKPEHWNQSQYEGYLKFITTYSPEPVGDYINLLEKYDI